LGILKFNKNSTKFQQVEPKQYLNIARYVFSYIKGQRKVNKRSTKSQQDLTWLDKVNEKGTKRERNIVTAKMQ